MTARVAIIGYSFRFPGVTTADYWQKLLAGEDLVTQVEPGRWEPEMYLHPDRNTPGTSYSFSAGSIGDVSGFDPGFFGISPREAAMMDPQQRLLLEMSWEAFERAGKKPSSVRGSNCGVYIGFASVDYAYRMAEDLAALDSSAATGNTGSIAANRLSYTFDLRGPSMAIDTACSSSLVAFHQACQSIRSGETEMALAGGVSLHLHPYGFVIFSKATMLSRKGRCNVFDESGDGYVRSEGGGIFLLKDYDKAIADGDPILAVVAASAVNTDGKKTGLTVPSYAAQASLLSQVYGQAGISADEIDYLEAHGTGTAVGDPIETRAIGLALGKLRSKDSPLPIGSVKSNMGHLETASGMAGLVKALHVVQQRVAPATIGIKRFNPKIDFDDLNLQVVTESRPLKAEGQITVGVNSFGFGGANAHVILQSPEPVASKPSTPTRAILPLRISARSTQAVKMFAANLLADLAAQDTTPDLYDYTYTLLHRREHFEHNAVAYVRDVAELKSALQAIAADAPPKNAPSITSGSALTAPRGPVFVFSGNGSQWQGMGKTLLMQDDIFQATIAEIDGYFLPLAGWSLRAHLAGDLPEQDYDFTEIAQPALFALQVGMVRMLASRGVHPAAVTGHSVGEVAAAWCAGALSLEDATRVIYNRSHWQGKTKGQGAMTAVGLGEADVIALLANLQLEDRVALAGINSSRGSTLAGAAGDLTPVEQALAGKGTFYKRLDLDYAFHSAAMDPIERGVIASLASLQPGAGNVPFYSTVSGAKLDGEKLDAAYWWQNIRQPVLFASATDALIAQGMNVFVEIGPHPVMRSYIADALKAAQQEGANIATLHRNDEDSNKVWAAAHRVLIAGCENAWNGFYPVAGQLVDLPHYPWQRERLWHETTSESIGLLQRKQLHPLLGHAVAQFEGTWENRLDTASQSALADHVVGDATVFPGTGYVEIALAAARAQSPESSAIELEELEILAPLILSDGQIKICRTARMGTDGALQIQARDYAGEAGAWTLHAKARVRPEPGTVRLAGAERLAVPTRPPHFTAASHALLTQTAGLAYGPAFRCIKHGWINEGVVLAELVSPAEIQNDLDSYLLHPALLDCTFQLIIQLLRDEVTDLAGIAFVPTKIGHITFAHNYGRAVYARAKLLQRAPHSLTAEFTLFNAEGEVIARIEEARFRSVRLHKGKDSQLHLLDYTTESAPLQDTGSMADSEALVSELMRQYADSPDTARFTSEVDPLLDAFASQCNYELLHDLSQSGSLPATWHAASGHDAAQRYAFSLAMANSEGGIERNADGWQLGDSPNGDVSAQAIWQALLADYPDYFQLTHAIDLAAKRAKGILDSATPALRLPASQRAQLWQAALGARKQLISATTQHWLSQQLAALPSGQRLAVLEICGADSMLLKQCRPLLADERFSFALASESSEALGNVQHQLEEHANLAACLLEDSVNLDARVDLAILVLDFIEAGSLQTALQLASRSLRKNGSLVLLGRQPSRWMDFVEGLPQIYTKPYVAAALDKAGFETHTYENTDNQSDLFVMSARIRATAQQTPEAKVCALFWAAPTELPDSFADELSQSVTCLVGMDDAALAQARQDAGERPLNIVLAHGLFETAVAPEDIVRWQTARCHALTRLHVLLEAEAAPATIWVPTRGAGTHLLPEGASLCAGDSALWGFARTLQNESSTARVRLLDLDPAMPLDAIAAALSEEMAGPDAETEVIRKASGERFATRMRNTSLTGSAQAEKACSSTHISRLGFQFPGQLRNLQWESAELGELGDEQLDVEVRATGLNFRDVMYALGLLSDEAVENGFAGPSLGLEFAGRVRRVGSKVTGYQAGDMVVGFGPYSFADRVYTTPSAIAHIPQGISCEAAATIPSVFFTVYYALHHLARLQAGERILIHGAAGGVGIAAIQLARHLGAEIFATAGSDEKRAFLRNLGVNHIYDSRSLAFADEILRDTAGEGVDVVLNSLAGEAVNRNFDVLRPFGRFLELGKRDFYENTKVGLRPFRNNVSYFGIDADQLMQVKPALTQRLFAEVIALFADGTLTPLPYQVFDAAEVVDAFRQMQQARQIGKIVVTYYNGIQAASAGISGKTSGSELVLDGKACYLVTGGLNGFGLQTAKWLAARGARHLLLLSRRGAASEEAQEALADFAAQGIKAEAIACDVTDRAALSIIFSTFGKSRPQLKGLVHAAVVIEDGLVRNLDAGQIEKVLRPKLLGADYLDALSRTMPLDFFVLYSSGTTLFGNPGQASYVAANCYLESLAAARRAAGLPATCARWGAIDDVGFLARNVKIKDALQSRMGGQALTSATALDVLGQMILTGSSDLGVLELDWRALERFLPSADSPKFNRIARKAGHADQGDDSGSDIQQMLQTLPDAELHACFVGMLKAEVGGILRISPDKIDADGSIYDMGLDSLMGVELVVALEDRFGTRLPVMALSQNPTINKLAEKLILQLKGQTESTPENETEAQIRALAAQHGVTEQTDSAALAAQLNLASTDKRMIQ